AAHALRLPSRGLRADRVRPTSTHQGRGVGVTGAGPRVSLVVAAARGGVIGREGGLPWRMPADMRHFQQVTRGHHVVMGRTTHASIGRPLPGRTNLVLSRDPRLRLEGCTVVHAMEEAIAATRRAGDDELFVIGGAQVYALALPLADRIHLTRI